MKKLKIALLGLGNVGSGVWTILQENKKQIIKRCGYDIEISKILVRDINKSRQVDVPKGIITDCIDDILNDDEIQIVVELMGGLDIAKDYMLRAMSKKKHIVSANKLAIAVDGEQLFKATNDNGVMFYYEAAVAGGIPVIQGINESLTANKITDIYGIINGTTNYILTKMSREGVSFESALKEAQDKGYAEADPTSDVEAFDAMYKLSILSSLSFNTKLHTNEIYREGITKITSTDIQFAKEFGYVIKLLAIGKCKEEGLELRVHPVMIPETHPLANVNDSFNAVFIKGNAVGDLMLYGRGAGDLPTGSAVVSDIIAIARDLETFKPLADNTFESNNLKVLPIEDSSCKYYIRLSVKDVPGTLGEVSMTFGKNNVSLESVIQKGKQGPVVTILIIAHETTEKNINAAISAIAKLNSVDKVENLIRLEKL